MNFADWRNPLAYCILMIATSTRGEEPVGVARKWITPIPASISVSLQLKQLPFVAVTKQLNEVVDRLRDVSFFPIDCNQAVRYGELSPRDRTLLDVSHCIVIRAVDVDGSPSQRYVFDTEEGLIAASFWLGASKYVLAPSPIVVFTSHAPKTIFVHFSAAG